MNPLNRYPLSLDRAVWDAYHGSPPRLYLRLRDGQARAWGHAARAPRQEVLDTLAALGLTIEREKRFYRFRGEEPIPYYVGVLKELR